MKGTSVRFFMFIVAVVLLVFVLVIWPVLNDNNHRAKAPTVAFGEVLQAPDELAKQEYVNFVNGTVVYLTPESSKHHAAIVSGPITINEFTGEPEGKLVAATFDLSTHGRLSIGDIITVCGGKLASCQNGNAPYYYIDTRLAELQVTGQTDIDNSCLAMMASATETALITLLPAHHQHCFR